MRMKLRLLAAALAPLALACWFLAQPGNGRAEGEKTPRDVILRIALAVSRNNQEEARREAGTLKDVDVDDIMPVFALRTPRNRRALGVGPVPGAIKPDGIEKKLEALATKELDPAELTAQAEALERAAYVTAAVAEVVRDKCPVETKQGNKDPKEWKAWSEGMVKASLELAMAAKGHEPARVKKAAERLDATCKSCHTPFK